MNLFENLSSEEKKLFSAYDAMAKSANFNRSDEEIFFDKISLLGSARLLANTTRKGRIIDDEYIKTKIMQLQKNPPDYSSMGNLGALNSAIKCLYEAKKLANYDRTAYGMYTDNSRSRQFTAKGTRFANYLQQSSNSIDIINETTSSWIYRAPRNFIKGKIDHRYAINAIPDKEFIQKLDDFATKHGMHYKTCRPTNWYDRNDSIVIYCPRAQTPEEIEELKKIAAPYIRRDKPSRINDLDGKLIADGIVTAKEVDLQQCDQLYQQLSKINAKLAQHFKETVDKNISKNPQNPISLGQFQNYTNLLDTFREFQKQNHQNNQNNQRLRGQDLVFSALDDIFAKNQNTPKTLSSGPSARQKSQEHMLSSQKNNFVKGNPQRLNARISTKPSLKKVSKTNRTFNLVKKAIDFPAQLFKKAVKNIYYKMTSSLKPQSSLQQPQRQNWRLNPQRRAMVISRYNRLKQHIKAAKKQLSTDAKDLIIALRNGNNIRQNPQISRAQTRGLKLSNAQISSYLADKQH